MTRDTEKSIRVHVLDREFGLRVKVENEAATREIAAYVDARIRAFRRAHPEHSEITAAIITALAIAEELYAAKDEHEGALGLLENQIDALDEQLAEVLQPIEDFSSRVEAAEPTGSTPPS
jgi:cell division protein ZapA